MGVYVGAVMETPTIYGYEKDISGFMGIWFGYVFTRALSPTGSAGK